MAATDARIQAEENRLKEYKREKRRIHDELIEQRMQHLEYTKRSPPRRNQKKMKKKNDQKENRKKSNSPSKRTRGRAPLRNLNNGSDIYFNDEENNTFNEDDDYNQNISGGINSYGEEADCNETMEHLEPPRREPMEQRHRQHGYHKERHKVLQKQQYVVLNHRSESINRKRRERHRRIAKNIDYNDESEEESEISDQLMNEKEYRHQRDIER